MKTTQASPDIADWMNSFIRRLSHLCPKALVAEMEEILTAYDAQASQAAAGDGVAPALDAPAQVFGTRFGKGTPWSTVILCAQRHATEQAQRIRSMPVTNELRDLMSNNAFPPDQMPSLAPSPTPEPDRLQAPAMVGEVVAQWRPRNTGLPGGGFWVQWREGLPPAGTAVETRVLYTDSIALRPVSEADAEAVVKTVSLFDHPKVRVTNALRALQARFESVQEKAP